MTSLRGQRGSVLWAVMLVTACGCVSTPGGRAIGERRDRTGHGSSTEARIRQVICLYNTRPWLNLDVAGDRDPEGIQFRVWLDPGTGRAVHRDGWFHIEMYEITRNASGTMERTLVSDWHYPTSDAIPVRSKLLGDGYRLELVWAKKSLAGHEVEIITRFEAPDGHSVRSATKRFRIPKYVS